MPRRPFRFSLIVLLLGTNTLRLPASSVREQLINIYSADRADRAALSPDGSRVAIAVHPSRGLDVDVEDITGTGARRRFTLDSRRTAETRFLGWVSSEGLVAASDSPSVIAIDAAHGVVKTLVDARTFRRLADEPDIPPRVRILNLLPGLSPAIVFEVTTRGSAESETPALIELYRCDIATGKLTRVFDRRVDPPGASLLTDWQGEPRVLFERGVLPQTYTYLAPGAKRWRRLDAVLANRDAFRFAVTRDSFLGERTIPLGFDFEGSVLYFASNIGRDTFAVGAVNLANDVILPLRVEDPKFDLTGLDQPWLTSPLVFDREQRRLVGVRFDGLTSSTLWLDTELQSIQATVAQDFPGRDVHILDWDSGRKEFLLRVDSLSTPGRFLIYRPTSRTYVDVANRARVDPDDINPTEPFSFAGPNGLTITGYVTLPHAAPTAKPALVLWFHDGPWQRVQPRYLRDAQGLAAMGFAVVDVNYRGSAGFGRAFRDTARVDLSQAPIEDAIAALTWLPLHYNVDTKRVAVAGEGFGAYLALRAAELHPDLFRGVVAINAVLDFEAMKESASEADVRRRAASAASDWSDSALRAPHVDGPAIGLGAQGAEQVADSVSRQAKIEADAQNREDQLVRTWTSLPLPELNITQEVSRGAFRGFGLWRVSVARNADKLTQPVLLIHDPRDPDRPVQPVRELRHALAVRKRNPEYVEISSLFSAGPAVARMPVFARIGEFLNTSLYDFHVNIGELSEKR